MKICFVSFGFNVRNCRLQPWNYTYQLAMSMIRSGHEVFICTTRDGSRSEYETFEDIKIIRVTGLNISELLNQKKVVNIISDLNSDVVFWPVGPTNFYHLSIIRKIDTPVVGIFFGPFHSLSEFKGISPSEILRNREFVLMPLISALIPDYLFRKLLAAEQIRSIIVLNNQSKADLQQVCSKKPISVFPPGSSPGKLIKYSAAETDALREKFNQGANFVLLYLGSPLTIRGLDLAIRSVYLLKDTIPGIRLFVLSRRRDDMRAQEQYITSLISKLDLASEVTVVSGFLSPEQISEYLSLSDCILLPFKMLQADMPLSILESLESGKIVISTNTGGIPEWLNGRGVLTEPNDLISLKEAILYVYNNPSWVVATKEKINHYISTYPVWDTIARDIIDHVEGLE